MFKFRLTHELCDKFLRPGIAKFIKSQPSINIKSSEGFRYSKSVKRFALKINFLGPKVYRLIKTTFNLPSIRTLQRVTERWEINSGFSDLVFKVFNLKGSTMSANSIKV